LIIIERKDNEDINRMLKRYKRKHKNVRLMRELRGRKHFTKKSVQRRHEILSAQYRLEKYGTD
jgi:small subunit ribosomal protein S21